MTRYTIAIGVLLILLGVGFYLGLASIADSSPSVTALIPAFAGVPILLLGVVSLKASLHKHAMHFVSLLALVGFLLPSVRFAMLLARGTELKLAGTASLVLMAVLCGSLLALCVKSFVNARQAVTQ